MKLTKQYIASLLPKRPNDANKGTFGKVLVFAGSKNYPGAAYLACAACYRIGAGLVTLVTDKEVKVIVSRKLPEVIFFTYSESLKKLFEYDVLLIGPGLGRDENKIELVKKLLKEKLPKAVIDGDGLNSLFAVDKWWIGWGSEAVLTPHPGEMARLTGLSVKQIQSSREKVAQEFSKKWNKILVLKGANTVIASPDGRAIISPFANPLLATAGTGDILAGVIAGLIAQGLSVFDSAVCGVYIHGLTGEKLKEKYGKAGMLASELLPFLPQIIKEII